MAMLAEQGFLSCLGADPEDDPPGRKHATEMPIDYSQFPFLRTQCHPTSGSCSFPAPPPFHNSTDPSTAVLMQREKQERAVSCIT